MPRRLLVSLTALLLLGSGQVSAKGLAEYVVITGPGLTKPLIVRGAAAHPLGMWLMEIPHALTTHPTHLGRSFTLTRDGFDRALYYPNPSGGQGYIFYVGLLNGSSEYDGQWFRASVQNERALQHILGTYGIHLSKRHVA